MKIQTALFLGASAVNLGLITAQDCPAGYSPVVSYVTVTYTEDPAAAGGPTTTIHTSSTTTATVTVTSGVSASPANLVEANVQIQSSTAVAATSPEATSAAGSGSTSLGSSVAGKATFYGGNLAGGACSFTDYTLPSGIFGAAFSGSAWDSSAVCGSCVSVTGPNGKTITAMVVDKCPECTPEHLDLFEDAFATIGDISAGVIDITYEFVTCPISSPLKLHNKEGSSEWWFSMQAFNTAEPIKSLEVSTDGGSTWKATQRTDYNFFQSLGGFGTSSVDVRVTSSTGKTVTVNDVPVADSVSAAGGSNF